jgi:diguanylate cyclase (GGDEF)-like protein
MVDSKIPGPKQVADLRNRERSSVRAGQVRIALGLLGLASGLFVPSAAAFAREFAAYAALALIFQWAISRRVFRTIVRVMVMGFVDTIFTSIVVQRFGTGTSILPLIYVMIPALYATTTPLRMVSVILAFAGTGMYASMVALEQLGVLPYATAVPAAVRPDAANALIGAALVTVATFVTAGLTGQLILALAHANARLRDLSQHDELTKLYNRRYVMERLEIELVRAERAPGTVTVAMVDLDGFKRVNDEIGHEAGDAVLKAVADALVAATRKGDVVARYGGDEFVVLLPNTDPDGARTVGVRMLDGAREAARRVCPSIPVSASIGTTTLRPSDDAAEVIRRVDEQLYAAKRAGGDRISTV